MGLAHVWVNQIGSKSEPFTPISKAVLVSTKLAACSLYCGPSNGTAKGQRLPFLKRNKKQNRARKYTKILGSSCFFSMENSLNVVSI